MKDTKPDWFRENIHGRSAMEARQFARSNGELNAPVRRRVAKTLQVPAKAARPVRRKPAKASAAQLPPMTPKRGHEAKSGFQQPQRKWDERCSTCAGTGFVIALNGGKVDCPKCG